jgi:hypothetical protein
MPVLVTVLYVYDKQKQWLLVLLLFHCFSLSCIARHNILQHQTVFSYGFGPCYEGQKNENVCVSLSHHLLTVLSIAGTDIVDKSCRTQQSQQKITP